MIDWLFIIFLVLAFLMIILSMVFDDNAFWNISFITVGCVLWLILALSVMEIEIPYEFYNATSGNLETGYHLYTSPISPYLTYLFLLFFILNLIYLIAMVFDKWYNYKNWHGGF